MMEDHLRKAKQLALKLLARREHSVQEMKAYLQRRSFTQEVIEETIQWLLELDYLNDRRFAEEFIRFRILRSGYGPRKIQWELTAKGVESELVEQLLGELYPPEEEERQGMEVAARWMQRRTKPYDPAQLYRYLVGRGFSPGLARRIAVCGTHEDS
jgi:regulatory protein